VERGTRTFLLSEKRRAIYDFYYVKCKFGCDDDRTCKDLNHESLSLSLSLFLNLRLHPLKCMLNDTESFIKSHFIDTLDSLISAGDARRLREIYWRFLINDEKSFTSTKSFT